MICEACGKNEALTTPVDGIDLGARFICVECVTLPSDVLARMIRERGEGNGR